MEVSAPFPFGQHVIDPMFDIGFKLIFGRENVSEPLLIDLLNSIFEGDPVYGNIVSVKFNNTEHLNDWEQGRGIRYDIKCVTAKNQHFIVEMQKAEQEHFLERCYYYVDRAIASQGYKGKDSKNKSWDFSLEPVVGVFFCNFHVRELDSRSVVKGRMCDEKTHAPIGDFERFVFIQIPFFNQEEDKCQTQLERWIYNIKNMGRTQSVAYWTINDTFKYLKSVSDVAVLPPEERDVYEAELMKARDYNAVMKTAIKKGLAEGRAEGLEKGRAEGRAEGLEKGLEKGRAEGLEKGRAEGILLIARNMIAEGMALDTITRLTGLTIEELEALN